MMKGENVMVTEAFANMAIVGSANKTAEQVAELSEVQRKPLAGHMTAVFRQSDSEKVWLVPPRTSEVNNNVHS